MPGGGTAFWSVAAFRHLHEAAPGSTRPRAEPPAVRELITRAVAHERAASWTRGALAPFALRHDSGYAPVEAHTAVIHILDAG